VTRRFARELALQALFAVEIGRHDPSVVLEQILSHRGIEEHRVFVKDLVLGTIEYAADADFRIAPLLHGWTIERLPTIDRLLLRMSLFELDRRSQTPRSVVINEAVELAKKFSTEESGRFVNGVLSSVSRSA
jgi:N utilization substance protein B